MALVGYARVSTTDQSLEIQIKQLKDAGCYHVFAEQKTGTSARTDKRPELALALAHLRPGDTLMVTRQDRLSRSIADHYAIMQKIEAAGATFRCLLQPEISTDTPQGRLVTGVLAVFAQFETEIRRERQKEGIARAKEKGVYGKWASRNGKLAAASAMLRGGKGYKEVAQRVGIPENTLRRRLPGLGERVPKIPGGSYHDGWKLADSPRTRPPSAVETVEEEATSKPTSPPRGLFSKFRRD